MTTQRPVIAGFPATLSSIDVGGEAIALWEVADLERHVDRTALGRGAVRPHGIRRGRPHDRSPPRARGRALVADARRIDTRGFYSALDAAGLAWRAVERAVHEEGLPLTVRLAEIARR